MNMMEDKMTQKQIYKNLYFDTELRKYFFIDENDKREIINQEAYLLIYIIELLQKNGKSFKNI